MGKQTGIAWTDHTFNIAWGCVKVSPGCKFCYADDWAHRYGHDVWGPSAPRRTFGQGHWNDPLRWNDAAQKAGKIENTFCSSMCDIGENHPTIIEQLPRMWRMTKATRFLNWQMLTKRSERWPLILPDDWGDGYPNVWLGVSVEDRERRYRIDDLRKVPAKVRFLSAEPLLEDISEGLDLTGIHWVIVGGESGPNARPMHPKWARNLLYKCLDAEIPFFFKQWGEYAPYDDLPMGHLLKGPEVQPWLSEGDEQILVHAGEKIAGHVLDDRIWQQFPKP